MVRKHLKNWGNSGESIPKKMVRYVYGTEADLAVIPLADLLGLDDRARLNTPGTLGSPNWEWRLESYHGLRRRIPFIQEVVADSGR